MPPKPEENAQGADSLPDAPQVVAAAAEPVAAAQVDAPQQAAPQVDASLPAAPQAVQAAPDAPDAVQAAPQVQAAASDPEQAAAAPQVVAATNAVPVDTNYSAVLGAVVHELAELYQIKDNARIEIGSDKVSAANFRTKLEVNDINLTITLTPVDGSAGTAALDAIKLKLAAPPAVVSAVEADAVEPAVVSPTTTSPAVVPEASETEDNSHAAADKAAADKAAAKSEGGYRRRKRNLRTIKKQQQRNRRTMNKH